MMSWWSDFVLAVESAMGGESNVENTAGPATATVPPAASGVIGVADSLLGIWTDLRDGKLWRSVGWLLLGIVLMLMGVAWWIGPSSARSSPVGIASRALG